MKNERLYNIDFLRLVFIIAIVVHHFYYVLTGHWTSGGFAVEFFFIISGFMFAKNFKPVKSTTDFIVSKLIRYMPVLCFSSIILAIFTRFNFQKLLVDILLLQRTGLYQLADGNAYNPPAWYISVLFWILLLYFYIKKNFSDKISNLLFAIITFVSFSMFLSQDTVLYISKHVLRGISALGIGYFSYIIFQNNTSCDKSYKNTPVVIISIFEALILAYLIFIIFSSTSIINPVGIQVLMAGLLILFSFKNGYISSLLNKEIFYKFSKYVLSIYLTHSIIYDIVLSKYLMRHYVNLVNYPICVCVLGVICSFVFGIIVYHIIEKPVTNYLANKYNKFKSISTKELVVS